MIRRKLLFAAGAGAGIVTFGCGNKDQPGPSDGDRIAPEDRASSPPPAKPETTEAPSGQPATSATVKPWRVGSYLPLSGGDGALGTDTREGIELAVAEINAAGGVHGAPIDVLFADDRSSANEVTEVVQQLIQRDRVVALIGEIASSRSLPGAILATKNRVPMISPSATHPDVTAGKPYAFRACFIDQEQGRLAAEFAVNVLRKKKIGLLFADDDVYSQGLAAEFKKAIPGLGARIVMEKAVSQQEGKFVTQVSELKAARSELVYAPLYYKQALLLGREAKLQGMTGGMFLGGDGWAGEQQLLDELEGAHYTDHWALDLPWAISRRFVEAYAKKFRKQPSSLAAMGYDSLLVLADAMKRSGAMTGDGIRDALAATRDFPGATGPITINADRNADKPVIVVQVRDKAAHYAAAVGRGSQAILAEKSGP